MDYARLLNINNENSPILITGHTGFKGTWLTMLLERLGVEVIGVSLPAQPNSLFERAARKGKIKEEFFDIRDEHKVQHFISDIKPKIIMHLAAQSLVLESYKDPKYTFEVNVGGLANILDAASKTESVEVILITTTDKVYENKGTGKAFSESDPLQGSDPYSASKVAAENVIFAWRELLKFSTNKKILTARAGNVIGGGDFSSNRLIPDLVRAFSTNSDLTIRNPSSTRPWQHVLDPIVGYLTMINHALSGKKLEILNFGPADKSLSVQKVVDIAKMNWPSSSKVMNNTKDEGFEAISLELNSELAMKELGWTPIWTQEAAVVESISWWRDVLSHSTTAQERCDNDINKILNVMSGK